MNNKSICLFSRYSFNLPSIRKYITYSLALFCMSISFGCVSDTISQPSTNKVDTGGSSLFDGKSLGKWEVSDFYKPGNVHVKDGSIYIEKSINGGFMQGINWTGSLVTMNYEITLEAMRIEGSDFFCGLTFPVGEQPCTLILGGWGGTLCGLSSLDNYDASENETTTFRDFKSNQWYKVRLRVEPERIQAWLDDEPLVDVDTTEKSIDIRIECVPSLPLGIATYQTTAAIRNIKLQKLQQ